MPFEYDIAISIYTIVVAALVLTVVVVLIRLVLAATRALNAYADDRKLRTALASIDLDSPDAARIT